jgi:hypothetical protein
VETANRTDSTRASTEDYVNIGPLRHAFSSRTDP